MAQRITAPPIPVIPEHTEYIKAGAITFGVEFRVLNDAVAAAAYKANKEMLGRIAAMRAKEPRRVLNDSGVSIHVFGNLDGELVEYLRFDCFVEDPHYHYIFPDQKVQDRIPLDTVAGGAALPWTLERLQTRLRAMLTRAGAMELANQVDQREIEAALPKVALAAEKAKQSN